MPTPEKDLVFHPNSPIYDYECEPTSEELYLETLDELTPKQSERISTYVSELWNEIRKLKNLKK